MDVAVSAGGEVGAEQLLREGEAPGEPRDPREVGDLPPAQYRHDDPVPVRGAEVTGEAAIRVAADPDLVHPGPLGLGQEAEMAAERAGHVLRRELDRVALTGTSPVPVGGEQDRGR